MTANDTIAARRLAYLSHLLGSAVTIGAVGLVAVLVGSMANVNRWPFEHRENCLLADIAVKARRAMVAAVAATVLIPSFAGAADGTAEQQSTDVAAEVSGQVTSQGGRPVAGSLVTMYAWPANSELASMAVGTTFDMVQVDSAVTDAQGGYSLVVSDAEAEAASDPGEGMNTIIEVQAPSGYEANESLPLPTADPGVARSAAAARTTTKRVKIAHVRSPIIQLQTRNRQFDSNKFAAAVSAAQTKPTVAADDPPADGGPCQTTYDADLGSHQVQVSGAYNNAGKGITHQTTYESSSTSTLGAGISSSGAAGSYSTNGTTTFNSTATQGFSKSSENQRDYTQFNYGRYYYYCPRTSAHHYEARANGYNGGAASNNPAGGPSGSYCVAESKGANFSISSSKASTYASGVSISGTIGIDLSASTGYSGQTRMSFSFPGKSARLCGSGGYPGGSPGTLVANG